MNLGDRMVDVIPTPGHNATHVVFYDRSTGLFFSGDFLMPGGLLIDDADADLASARRVAAFVKDRQVSYVLGGHIELDGAGETFPWESQHHPHEDALQMTKGDLLALPAAVSRFNGFYTRSGQFILINSMRIVIVLAVVAGLVLIALMLAQVRNRRSHLLFAGNLFRRNHLHRVGGQQSLRGSLNRGRRQHLHHAFVGRERKLSELQTGLRWQGPLASIGLRRYKEVSLKQEVFQ